MNRRMLFFAFAAGILTWGGMFVLLYRRPLSLFPENQSYFCFSPGDAHHGFGDSSHSMLNIGDTAMTFYSQCDSSGHGDVLVFHSSDLYRTIDFGAYDYLTIHTDSTHTDDFRVTFFFYIPGVSTYEDLSTQYPLSFRCISSAGPVFQVNRNDLAPDYNWIAENGELPRSAELYNGLTHIVFSPLREGSFSLAVREMAFQQKYGAPSAAGAGAGAVVFIVVLITGRHLRRQKNRSIKERIYSSSPVTPLDRNMRKRITAFIHSHAFERDFTLALVQEEFHLSYGDINRAILREKDLQYRQYLTKLRLNRASSLLNTSDLSIAEIAARVGYEYSNSFSRVFKRETGITPREYRRRISRGYSTAES
ncbi:MAG: helix-turn-helix domain-containing protein [Fibrobacterota bacterium]